MRLHPPGLLLLGAGLLNHVGLAVAEIPDIEFVVAHTAGPNNSSNSLLSTSDGAVSIKVSSSMYIKITKVSLVKNSDDVEIGFTSPGSAGNFGLTVGDFSPRSSGQLYLTTININDAASIAKDFPVSKDFAVSTPLYLKLSYVNVQQPPKRSRPGVQTRQAFNQFGTSALFSITTYDVNSSNFDLALNAVPQLQGGTTRPTSENSANGAINDGGGNMAPSTSASPLPGQIPVATTLPTSDETPAASAANSTVSSEGLSTAAIAGIAAGAGVVFLIVAGLLTFLFLRHIRNKKAADGGVGYGKGGRSGDLVAEKEAVSAAVAESGAHSPYSDDGLHDQQRDASLARAAAVDSRPNSGAVALMAAHQQETAAEAAADYTPYSDHDQPRNSAIGVAITGPVASAVPAAAAATTQPIVAAARSSNEDHRAAEAAPRAGTAMSGAYAHLVEDGMTADEIARLEDEERQLDQAIERARGVTTK